MRGVIANNSSQAHNVHGPSRPPPRDRSPDPPMGRSGCCTGFLCLGSLKRGKRIVPATRMHDGSNTSPRPWASNGAPQSNPANQYATLSPSLLAPPSSPASFQNSAVQSSAQSPCAFPVVSVPSATSQIPLERAQTMFQMGPYAHETALVSPPVFSNFTTAPSTAPFTPPPELATHLTTPSSPDVPFAQLLANSFGTKQAVRLQPAPTYSASPFASPDIFAADDLQAAYQLYPGSPLAHLLSPASGTGASTPFPDLEVSTQFTPFQDLENPVQAVASMFFPGSPLIQPDPPSRMELEVVNSCSFQEFGQGGQQLSATISSFLACGDDPSGPQLAGYAGRLIVGVNKASDGCQTTKRAGLLGSAPPVKDSLEEEKSAELAKECISKQENHTGLSKLVSADDVSSAQDEQSKLESCDQADRNLSEADSCNVSATGDLSESLSTGNGVSDDTSPVQQDQGNRSSSDETERNLRRSATCSLGSSDTSKESPSTGISVASDISSLQQEQGNCESSDQADRNLTQSAPCNAGSSEFLSESTVEGTGVTDDISLVQLEQGKQDLSTQADRNLRGTIVSNVVPRQVLDKCSSEGNGASNDISSTKQEPGNSDSSDQIEENLRRAVTGSLRSTHTANNTPVQRNDVVDSTNIPVQSEVHSGTLFNSSLLGLTIGDLVAWETSTGDKIPGKLSISKIALMETSRNGSAIHSRSSSKDSSSVRGSSPVTRLSNGRTSPATRLSSGGTSPVTRGSNGRTSPVTRLSSGGTSPVTRLSNGGTCADCARLQHVTVASTDGYFDVSSLQQFTFTGQKFEAKAHCNKGTSQDCNVRGKPESERGILKVLLEHTMEKPGGVEGMDRVAIYREQQLNVPMKWIQSGAKSHQRKGDSVSRELPELGGTCSGSQTGHATQLGMSLVAELK